MAPYPRMLGSCSSSASKVLQQHHLAGPPHSLQVSKGCLPASPSMSPRDVSRDVLQQASTRRRTTGLVTAGAYCHEDLTRSSLSGYESELSEASAVSSHVPSAEFRRPGPPPMRRAATRQLFPSQSLPATPRGEAASRSSGSGTEGFDGASQAAAGSNSNTSMATSSFSSGTGASSSKPAYRIRLSSPTRHHATDSELSFNFSKQSQPMAMRGTAALTSVALGMQAVAASAAAAAAAAVLPLHLPALPDLDHFNGMHVNVDMQRVGEITHKLENAASKLTHTADAVADDVATAIPLEARLQVPIVRARVCFEQYRLRPSQVSAITHQAPPLLEFMQGGAAGGSSAASGLVKLPKGALPWGPAAASAKYHSTTNHGHGHGHGHHSGGGGGYGHQRSNSDGSMQRLTGSFNGQLMQAPAVGAGGSVLAHIETVDQAAAAALSETVTSTVTSVSEVVSSVVAQVQLDSEALQGLAACLATPMEVPELRPSPTVQQMKIITATSATTGGVANASSGVHGGSASAAGANHGGSGLRTVAGASAAQQQQALGTAVADAEVRAAVRGGRVAYLDLGKEGAARLRRALRVGKLRRRRMLRIVGITA